MDIVCCATCKKMLAYLIEEGKPEGYYCDQRCLNHWKKKQFSIREWVVLNEATKVEKENMMDLY